MAGGSASTGRKNVDVSNIFFINMLSKAFAAVIILFLIVPKGKPDKPAQDAYKDATNKCTNLNAFLKKNETKIPKEQLEELKKYAAGFQESIDNLHNANKLMAGDRDLWQKRALAAEDSLSKYKCGPGYHFDKKEGKCIKDKDCPNGQYWDEKKGNCIDDPAPCQAGETWDPVAKKCVKIGPVPPPPCLPGQYWSAKEGKCIDNPIPCVITDPFAFIAKWDNGDDEVDLYMGKEGGGKNSMACSWAKNAGELHWKKGGRSSSKVYKNNIADGSYDVYIHYYKKNRKKTTSTDNVKVEISWAFNPQNANKEEDRGGGRKKKDAPPTPAPTPNAAQESQCRNEGYVELAGGFKEPLKKDNAMPKLGTIKIEGGKVTFTPSGLVKIIK
jgi:hypothetical protein